jgi:biotin carboxyl carrier protein
MIPFKVLNGIEFDDQTIRLQLGNRLIKGYVSCTSDYSTYNVFIDGVKYTVLKAEPPKRESKSDSSNAKVITVKSAMPGRIVAVSVKPGDKVSANTKLLVMEAMKMEMVVSSPVTGIVKKVQCHVGQSVAASSVLLEIEGTPV